MTSKEYHKMELTASKQYIYAVSVHPDVMNDMKKAIAGGMD